MCGPASDVLLLHVVGRFCFFFWDGSARKIYCLSPGHLTAPNKVKSLAAGFVSRNEGKGKVSYRNSSVYRIWIIFPFLSFEDSSSLGIMNFVLLLSFCVRCPN